MSLRPISRARQFRKFTAYDLEWVPGEMRVRICGCYDERGYRYYSSVEKMLAGELVHKNRGRWYYAHAGGLADVQFVLEVALRRGWRVECAFSGSSAIIVRIMHRNVTWTFLDSYWLLRAPLDEIGQWIGIEKGASEARMTEESAREWYATAPIAELREYNERDCVILWQAIHEYQCRVLEMGGQLQRTQAACAMHLFRRKYLTQTIPTSPRANAIAREAYSASRVEVFASHVNRAFYYDINSSFPSAMTRPQPGKLKTVSRSLPDDESKIFLADVDVEIRDCYMPPIPTRVNGRLFFPIGKWRAWLSSVDIFLLLRDGHRVLRTHSVIEFEPMLELAQYATDLYERRRKETDKFARIAYKLLLNSLYGKFGERPEKKQMLYDPPNASDLRQQYEPLLPGLWLVDRVARLPHEHVPISVHITALARKALYDFMSQANEVYYCDTDGFATNSRYETSDNLGGLKLEKILGDEMGGSRFIAAKLYCLDGADADGNPLPDDVAIAAKGFSRMNRKRFDILVNGGRLDIGRMARLRELWRKGTMTPEDLIVSKGLKENVPKRRMLDSGNSRPWTIDEVRSFT